MRYPHVWTCTRPDPANPGTQDPGTGAWTPGGTLPVYDGAADCQDEGETIQRDADGRPVSTSEATLYLADESRAAAHRIGDTGTVTWEDGTTSDAEVARVVRLDGKLHLKWL
jgi:hypothetical protein